MSELSTLLTALPVPDHRPGFWEELEARLATVDARNAADTSVTPLRNVDAEVDTGDTALDELHHWRRRRWLIATAAAAAIVGIIFGLNALTEDTGPAPTITDITTTTTTTTAAPPDGDAAPPPAIDVSTPLGWSRQTSNLRLRGFLAEVAAADEVFYALDADLRAAPSGLMRSSDGLVWETVDASTVRVGDRTPSWSTDTSFPDFTPVALAVNGRSVSVAEITHASNGTAPDERQGAGAGIPADLRIWRSNDDWSLVDFPVFDPPVDALVSIVQEVRIAESPDTLVVVRTLYFDVDWWQFAPEGLEFDIEAHNEEFARSHIGELPLDSGTRYAHAAPDGVAFSWLPDEPVVVWDDLPPEAKETYDWWSETESQPQPEYYAVASDGGVSRLDDSLAPSIEFRDVRWSGTRFVVLGTVWSSGRVSVAFSTDGRSWGEPVPLPGDVGSEFGIDALDDSLFVDDPRGLMVSTDLGATFEFIDADLPEWGPVREIPLADGSGTSITPTWWFAAGGLTVQHGVATGVVRNNPNLDGDLWLIRSTDGVQWTTSKFDLADGAIPGIDPQHIAIAADGTTYIYSSDGTVDIGRPSD